MLIDIHSHHKSIIDDKFQLTFVVNHHSLGIHPWELTLPFDETTELQKITELKAQFNSKILAIGECGLDRRRKDIVNIDIQEKVLNWHMDWALEVKRPLILHCVKAEADLLKILKKKRYPGRILLHDFGGSLETAQSLLKYDFFFSFGKRLFNPNSQAAKVMKSLPQNKIFIETDDQTDFSLEDIFQKATSLLKLESDKCEELFFNNLLSFFSDLNDLSSTDIINYLSSS